MRVEVGKTYKLAKEANHVPGQPSKVAVISRLGYGMWEVEYKQGLKKRTYSVEDKYLGDEVK